MRMREPIFASVNVSSRQLLRHDLIQDLRTVLARSARRARHAQARTDRVAGDGKSRTRRADAARASRELGAGLSLDDFGTGHSSLAYLQRFPFDTIKIDQSFVRTNGKGTRPVILRSIIALAHDLGMEVVAEGAETDSRCGRALPARLRIRAGLCLRRADDAGRRRSRWSAHRTRRHAAVIRAQRSIRPRRRLIASRYLRE